VNAVAVRVPNVNALAALRADLSVVDILPDREVHMFAKPGPGGGGGSGQIVPEGVKRVGIPTSSSHGGGVGVAVLDTGIDPSHPDLDHPAEKFDAYGGTCSDAQGHGTHVAGTIAAKDNSEGVLGVAPQARVYCVKVLNDQGSGSDSSIILGLQWVLSNGDKIRIVNMSLGRDKVTGDMNLAGTMRGAIKALYDAGITVVVAAGNDASKEVSQLVPAGFPEVIAVASTTAINGTNGCLRLSSPIAADTASYFTTDGKYTTTDGYLMGVSISAPGEDAENVSRGCLISSVGILSLKPSGGTQRMSGTSMSSPHVAGVAARLIQTGTATGPEGIRGWLRGHADRNGEAPLNAPVSSYTFDGEREGIAKIP